MPKTELNFETLNEDYFYSMADRLMNECYLEINTNRYRIREIEFYLNSENHPDPYVHCAEDQLLLHQFYFHKHKNGSHKGGTYKGLDLIFGDVLSNAYFGILLRTIENIETGQLIQGPCKIVDHILETYGYSSISDFIGGDEINIFENLHNFVIRINDLEKEVIYFGPRIGLSNKFPDWQLKNYRYVIGKEKVKKNKTSLIMVKPQLFHSN